MKQYRLDYRLDVPVRGEACRTSHARRTIPGYCGTDAARRLRSGLKKKWVDGCRVTIEGGIIFGDEGWVALDPDLLPLLNSPMAGADRGEGRKMKGEQ